MNRKATQKEVIAQKKATVLKYNVQTERYSIVEQGNGALMVAEDGRGIIEFWCSRTASFMNSLFTPEELEEAKSIYLQERANKKLEWLSEFWQGKEVTHPAIKGTARFVVFSGGFNEKSIIETTETEKNEELGVDTFTVNHTVWTEELT